MSGQRLHRSTVTSNPVPNEDATARLAILNCAMEECYGVKEFIENLLNAYSSGTRDEKMNSIKRLLQQLSDEGLVRLHWGHQCSRDSIAAEALTIHSPEVDQLPDDVWIPYTERMVCVHGTELTVDAYDRACRKGHPGTADSS
jgi:hypothetical protein